jgi:hypothetical protein
VVRHTVARTPRREGGDTAESTSESTESSETPEAREQP